MTSFHWWKEAVQTHDTSKLTYPHQLKCAYFFIFLKKMFYTSASDGALGFYIVGFSLSVVISDVTNIMLRQSIYRSLYICNGVCGRCILGQL